MGKLDDIPAEHTQSYRWRQALVRIVNVYKAYAEYPTKVAADMLRVEAGRLARDVATLPDEVRENLRTLERAIGLVEEHRGPPDHYRQQRLDSLIDKLEAFLLDNAGAPREREERLLDLTAEPLPWLRRSDKGLDVDRVFLLGLAESLEIEIGVQLMNFDFTVKPLASLEELLNNLRQVRPGVLLTDYEILERQGDELVDILAGAPGQPPPLVVLNGPEAIEARLRATRYGSQAYFTDMIDAAVLADTLDRLSGRQNPEPYRVLVVDDDPAVVRFYEELFVAYGLPCDGVTDPMAVLETLVEFQPDLLMIDLYMLSCTGVDLARAIRQKPECFSLPIVFFSTERDLERQTEAVSLAADDFLPKGLPPASVVQAVVGRARRSRRLRSMLFRDSLTDLLNHTSLKQALESEVLRAERSGASFAFAMLDLDHFKRVNDAHGHATGDLVLKSLSRRLRQRLRKTDILGRYGGEEFAAILLDARDKAAAFQVMDDFRKNFGHIQHHATGERFRVTLSCGVAMYPEFPTAQALAEAADKALYEAKQTGRNRVVVAG